MESYCENKYAYIRIADDIVFVESKENVVLDIDMAKLITADRIHLQKNKSYSIFFQMNGISDSDKEGRDYLAKYGWLLATQVCIYSSNFISFSIASFYLKVSKPSVPTKLFRKELQAIAFLKSAK